MSQTLDIQKVISTSTSNVTLDDLNKKGFRQVKVLNQTLISRLIGEAVDRVLEDRCREITKDEREKVIKEARSQFEILAKRRLEKEHLRIDYLEKENASLSAEVDTLKKVQTVAMQVQAERDQALARLQVTEADIVELKAKIAEQDELLARKKAEFSQLEAAMAAKSSEADRLGKILEESTGESRAKLAAVETRLRESEAKAERAEKQLHELQAHDLEHETAARQAEAEVARVREALFTTEKSLAMAEGLLAAKKEELDRLVAEQANSEPAAEKLLLAITQRLEQIAKPSEVSQIMLSLDGLQRRLSNMSMGGGYVGSMDMGKELRLENLLSSDGVGAIESNVSKVKVKQAKAGDVREALARLKKMQKEGGEDGE